LYKGKPDGTYSFTRFDVPLEHWQAVGWTQRVDTGDPSNSVIAMNDNMAVMIWSSGDDFSAFAARIADKLAIIDNTGP
jgi:hypothetical protein